MKTAAHNRFAAVLLLAPLAAAVFATRPAHAQVQFQFPAAVVQVQQMAAPPAMVQVQDRQHYDRRAPEITDVTPEDGSRVLERGGRTLVTARIFDNRSGVDYSSVRLRVDGRDVTRRARVEGDLVRYRDDFTPGQHVAEVSVRDRAGNWTRRSWSFNVVERGRHYGYNDAGRW